MLSIDFLFDNNKYLSEYTQGDWIIEDSITHKIYNLQGELLPHLRQRVNSYEENAHKIIGWTWLLKELAWSPMVKKPKDVYGYREFLNLKSNKIERVAQYGFNYILHANYTSINKFEQKIFEKWPNAKLGKDFLEIGKEKMDIRIFPPLKEYVDDQILKINVHKSRQSEEYFIDKFDKLTKEQKSEFISKWTSKYIKFNDDKQLSNIMSILSGAGLTQCTEGHSLYPDVVYIYKWQKYAICKSFMRSINYSDFILVLKNYLNNSIPAFKIMAHSTYGSYLGDFPSSTSNNKTEDDIESEILKSHPKVLTHTFDKTIGLTDEYILL